MKRSILLLAVVSLMVALTAVPAFGDAKPLNYGQCNKTGFVDLLQ